MTISNIGVFNKRVRDLGWWTWYNLNRFFLQYVSLEFANQPLHSHNFGSKFIVPRLRLHGYKGPVEVVISLITPDGRPHPHMLEGPGCRNGICVYRTGCRDGMTEYCTHMYKGWRNPLMGFRSNEEYKRLEREITWNMFKEMWKNLCSTFLGSTIVEVPNLRICPVGKHKVGFSLAQREKLSNVGPEADIYKSLPQVNDPFQKGFSHKRDPSSIDLTTVRISFTVYMIQYHGKWNFKPIASDVIFDSSPRIVSMTKQQSEVQGKEIIQMEVSRADVKVEFYDETGWSVIARAGGSEWEDEGSSGEMVEQYTALLEVEVPEYGKKIQDVHKVKVRLVTADGNRSPTVDFLYIPSKYKMDGVKESVENLDLLTLALKKTKEEETEEDYLTRLPTPPPSVLRPAKMKRKNTSMEISNFDSKSHKKQAQQMLVNQFFKNSKS